jgi:phospholipid/cholesterol/gamma-HCH transport system substrate-binding protein
MEAGMSAAQMNASSQAKASSGAMGETLIGLGVVIAAILIGALVYFGKGSGTASGYDLNVRLAKADGLGVGTEVRLSGIKVGSVTDMTLDPRTFLVTVHMQMEPGIEVPVDSSILVTSAGLLGSPYLSITPGGDDAVLKPGGTIENAQGSIDIMSLVGRFATGAATTNTPPAPQALPDGP